MQTQAHTLSLINRKNIHLFPQKSPGLCCWPDILTNAICFQSQNYPHWAKNNMITLLIYDLEDPFKISEPPFSQFQKWLSNWDNIYQRDLQALKHYIYIKYHHYHWKNFWYSNQASNYKVCCLKKILCPFYSHPSFIQQIFTGLLL